MDGDCGFDGDFGGGFDGGFDGLDGGFDGTFADGGGCGAFGCTGGGMKFFGIPVMNGGCLSMAPGAAPQAPMAPAAVQPTYQPASPVQAVGYYYPTPYPHPQAYPQTYPQVYHQGYTMYNPYYGWAPMYGYGYPMGW
jgi:hypothetical protein